MSCIPKSQKSHIVRGWGNAGGQDEGGKLLNRRSRNRGNETAGTGAPGAKRQERNRGSEHAASGAAGAKPRERARHDQNWGSTQATRHSRKPSARRFGVGRGFGLGRGFGFGHGFGFGRIIV